MSQLRVGVLRGGPSSEYEVSLKTGASILENLPAHYKKEDILITKNGLWHFRGAPFNPLNLPLYIDVAFLGLHGEYGEDGRVQKILEDLRLPFTGSGSLASALGMHKEKSKNSLANLGIKMPRHLTVHEGEDLAEKAHLAFLKFAPPYVVKPANLGSSVGVIVVKTAYDLPQALRDCLALSPTVLIEEYIRGKEATCGVVEELRGKKLYPLFPVEIIPASGKVFNYDDKYSQATRKICPGNFTASEKDELMRVATLAHQTLGLRHYSRSDFIVSPRGVYYLETNSLPGLTTESLLPTELTAAGVSYPAFLEHVLNLTLHPVS